LKIALSKGGTKMAIRATALRAELRTEMGLLHKPELEQRNAEIEFFIVSGELEALHLPFQLLDKLSTKNFQTYMKNGSYYPALARLMERGEFQTVLNALETLKEYTKFQTPKILLCKAACFLKLHRRDESLAVVKDCKQTCNFHDTLYEIIISSPTITMETKAFEELLNVAEGFE
jgi:hypothetical protein